MTVDHPIREIRNDSIEFQMVKIKQWMMETLLTVTSQEIVSVVNEVYSQTRKKGEHIHSDI